MAEAKRVKLMRGDEASRLSVIPAQGEQIMTLDELKLFLGDGNKLGGYVVNADSTIAVWADQTDAIKKHSLAWWIAYFNGAEATVRIPRGTHEVLYDMTIPENICLKFDKGANLKVSDTKTLTINGAIEAGPWQIFSGDGVIAGTPKVESIYIEWFGAVGDGETDSTTAIQAAMDWAFNSGVNVYGCKGTYIVTDTLKYMGSGDMGQMTINVDGIDVNPAFFYGGDTYTGAYNQRIVLPIINCTSKPVDGWDASNSVGLILGTCNQCVIDVIKVSGFCNGIICGGYDGGFAYNTINLQTIYSNKRNLILSSGFGAGSQGWCNENIFNNGRFGLNSSDTTDYTDTRNIVLTKTLTSVYGAPNNNLFLKPSVESAQVEYSIELNYVSYNTFLNGRFEGTGAIRINVIGPCNNLFIGGYSTRLLQFTGKPQTIYDCRETKIVNSSSSFNSYSGSSGWELATFNAQDGLSEAVASFLVRNGFLRLRYHTHAYPSIILDAAKQGIYLGGGNDAIDYTVGFRNWGSELQVLCSIIPVTTTTCNLGNASAKWGSVYATNGTIQTSDERVKAEISSIPDEWLDAWGDVDYTRFKMVDAVQKKGSDNARWHIGLIAQRVKEVFEARGLDAMKIGLLCYDEWEDQYEDVEVVDDEEVLDEEGNLITPRQSHFEKKLSMVAGNLYSIRYDEALAMEAAYMRREVERLKSSINA